jgi:hypothetical protein
MAKRMGKKKKVMENERRCKEKAEEENRPLLVRGQVGGA